MNASRWDVTDEEYFADEMHESNSRLAVFRHSVPAYYHTFIEPSIKQKQTKSMGFGSAFHLALLQPKMYEQMVVVGPDINKNTTEYKTWKAKHAYHIIIDPQQERAIQEMVNNVVNNKAAYELLNSAGKPEQPIRWQDDKTEIWLKAKLDYMLEIGTVLDIKTCADPNPNEFSRSCGQLDYQCQAAMYKDGILDLTGNEVEFIHIAVGVEAPYECIVHRLTKEAIDLGRSMNTSVLRRLKDCRDTGVWESQYAHQIVDTDLPRWSFNRSPSSV